MLPRGHRIGPYEILSDLGRGGMATLYRARRTGPGDFSRDVAIKLTHPELSADPDVVKMFLDEARLSACIQHPNVVHVEGIGEVDGQQYIVMELIDGVTLADVMRDAYARRERLPVEVAIAIATKVAEGLHAAHESVDNLGRPLNIIHRDVSPQNILLTRRGHVKLIDFGVAKAKHRLSRTAAGSVKGKLAYMAPEQLAMHEVDRRVDVFALGIVLWEMLALARLFHAKNDLDTMMRIRDAIVPPLREHRDDLPPNLDYVVQTMLARSLEERFSTAAAARAALLTTCPGALAIDADALAQLVRGAIDEDGPTLREAPTLGDEGATVIGGRRARSGHA